MTLETSNSISGMTVPQSLAAELPTDEQWGAYVISLDLLMSVHLVLQKTNL
jgi:hypothetical protein